MDKTAQVWCKNVITNILKILTPLPSLPGGQKALKLEKKKHVFSTKSLYGAKTVNFGPSFISYFERGMFGHDIPRKKSRGNVGAKFSTVFF